MTNRRRILVLIIVAIVAVTGISLWVQTDRAGLEQTANTPTAQTHTVTLSIEDVLPDTTIDISSGGSLLDLLTALSEQSAFTLETEDYGDLGVLVIAIGKHTNGENNEYWQYYVNNEQPLVSADKYLVQPGDLIEWRFEQSVF